VLGLAATFLVAGCDHGDDIGGSPPGRSESPTGSTPSSSVPQQTPDEALVDSVVTALSTAAYAVRLARREPDLREVASAVLRAHRAHAHSLEAELDVRPPPGSLPAAGNALAALRSSERQLHTSLVDAAGRAESGALARLLASMAASTAQHLAALPKRA
jgi:hypothetical protein